MAARSLKEWVRSCISLAVLSAVLLSASATSAVPHPSSLRASRALAYQLRGAESYSSPTYGTQQPYEDVLLKWDSEEVIAESVQQANLTTHGRSNFSTNSLPSGPPYTAYTTCGSYESGAPWDVSGGVPVVPFLGIRYASPMDSSLRWKPPVDPDCQLGRLVTASEWGVPCVQLDGSGVEDCLMVNVFVPEYLATRLQHDPTTVTAPVPSGDLLPVFVYLHGGGLVSGTSNGLGVWDAAVAPETGGGYSIVVSGNYRLNTIGFLATEELSMEQNGMSGNYGIQDQQLMLKWVQQHISRFGGDASRVTVVGQSSGGTSIFALMSSPASVGLFQRAISLSGSPNVTMSLETAQQQNVPIVAALGCSNFTTWEERLQCMRSVPAATVAAATPPSWLTPGLNGLPLSPQGQRYAGLPIVDGRVVTMSFYEAMAAGLVDVPLILSSMQHEVNGWSGSLVFHLTNIEWASYLHAYFGSWPRGTHIARSLYRLYEPDSDHDPQKAYDAMVSDYSLTCGNIANAMAGAGGNYTSPIYVVLNQWGPAPEANPRQGSPHARRMPHVTKGGVQGIINLCMTIFTVSCVLLLTIFLFPGHGTKRYGMERRVMLMLPLGTMALVSTLGIYPPPLGQVHQYAFHTWDLLAWMRAVPQPVAASDAALSVMLRDAFHQLASNGTIDPALGWQPITTASNWPDSYTVTVVRDPSRTPFLPTAPVENFKADVCSMWASHGVGQASWWCN